MEMYTDFDLEKGFPMNGVDLKYIASLIGGRLQGENREVKYLAGLTSQRLNRLHFLSYVTGEDYWPAFVASYHESAVIDQKLYALVGRPENKSVIVVDKN